MIRNYLGKVVLPSTIAGAMFALLALLASLSAVLTMEPGVLAFFLGVAFVDLSIVVLLVFLVQWILASVTFGLCSTIRFVLTRGKDGF